ncbi:MAG: DUF6603 domain-containing protein [Cytophagales bacterium]|nr:DUF6603 domain-containing protein [Cytophagales bacterium]
MLSNLINIINDASGDGTLVLDTNLDPALESLLAPLGLNAITLEEVADADSGDTQLFRIEFEAELIGLTNGFSALASLAGGSESDLELPSGLSGLASFYLAALELGFNSTDQKLSVITFTVATIEPWNTPIPDFSILGINTTWTYTFNSEGNSIEGEVTGALQIGYESAAVYLDVSAYMPDFNITAQLSEGDSIEVKDLLNYYFGNTVTFDTNMSIDQCIVYAYPSEQTYTLSAAFADVWNIETDSASFGLDPVNVDMAYDNTALTLNLGAGFNLQLTTDDGGETVLAFEVSAQKAPEGQGWQFDGNQTEASSVSIGTLISYIANQFGVDSSVPEIINDLTISNLGFSFNTLSKDFTFSGELDFPITDTTSVALILDIALGQAQDGTYNKTFTGQITIGSGDGALVFDITLDQSDSGSILLGTYLDATGKSISLSDLLSSMMDISIPDVLTFAINNALYLYDKPTNETARQLFVAQMGNGLDLSTIPVLGETIGSNPIKLDYQFLIPSGTFETDDLSNYNTMLPEGFPALPTENTLSGITINITLLIGDKTIPLSLPISTRSTDDSTTSGTEDSTDNNTENSTPIVADDAISETEGGTESGTWFDIQKQLGPVYFDKIGLNFSDSKLWFLIEASLTAAGLTISLDGLAIGSPLTSFDPTFSLSGIGIDYSSGSTNIGGSFLATQDADGNDIYSGTATITASSINISALGSYGSVDGASSLFIYATVNKALGGPSFFYVTGVAAAFGYNRELIMPAIEEVNEFPLVTTAMAGEAMPEPGNEQTFLTDALNALNAYIPPSEGQYFLAAGVAFTTYNMLDSFALLAVSFGNKFRIDIVGLSNMVLPSNSKDFILAEMQLALTASFVPDDGILQVTAQLTDGSYFLSPDCQLSGGFAFYSWFSGDYEGDFVLTIGGYHPDFNVPSHYPTVPRLGFDWQVDDSINLSGDAYFALCAHAFMVGGSFSAVYASGSFEASFNLGADFLISWQPYYYSASFYCSLGCDYTYELFGTHSISIELGADLAVAGPDFGGSASVKILIFTIKIKFGDQGNDEPNPISYSEFKSGFLPASSDDSSESEVGSINFTAGVIGQTSGDIVMDIVNPKDLVIATDSVIPAKSMKAKAATAPDNDRISNGEIEISLDDCDTDFGVAPMDLDDSGIEASEITVTVTREGLDVGEDFGYTPITKKMPTAVWGTEISADINGDRYVENAVTGVQLIPQVTTKPGQTQPIDAANLAYDITPVADAFQWETYNSESPQTERGGKSIVSESIGNPDLRSKLLERMGMSNMTIDVSNKVADELLYEPTVY